MWYMHRPDGVATKRINTMSYTVISIVVELPQPMLDIYINLDITAAIKYQLTMDTKHRMLSICDKYYSVET